MATYRLSAQQVAEMTPRQQEAAIRGGKYVTHNSLEDYLRGR